MPPNYKAASPFRPQIQLKFVGFGGTYSMLPGSCIGGRCREAAHRAVGVITLHRYQYVLAFPCPILQTVDTLPKWRARLRCGILPFPNNTTLPPMCHREMSLDCAALPDDVLPVHNK